MLGTKSGTILIWDFLTATEISNLTKDIEYNNGSEEPQTKDQIEQNLKACPISVMATGDCKKLS